MWKSNFRRHSLESGRRKIFEKTSSKRRKRMLKESRSYWRRLKGGSPRGMYGVAYIDKKGKTKLPLRG